MRKYINIIEGAGFRIPDFTIYITDALVDRILTTKRWVDHGSWLDDGWIEEMCSQGKDFFPFEVDWKQADCIDKLKALPGFREWFKNYLFLRARYIRETFIGQHGFTAVQGSTRLYRAIMVSKQWVNAVRQPSKGMLPLGIFWGVGEVHAWGHDTNVVQIQAPCEVILSTTLANVMVDWEQTFYSRLDYDNGDMEQEIRLMNGSVISNVKMELVPQGHSRDCQVIRVDPSRQFIA
jgi:hypothetical protein